MRSQRAPRYRTGASGLMGTPRLSEYYLLQSVARTMHSPALSLSQLFRASRRAVSRSLRQAAPACLPSSVVASAPHMRGPTLPTTLQPLAPHSPSAASSARFPVG